MSCSENRHQFSEPNPSTSYKWERQWLDSGRGETIRRSKDPPIILTAQGTTQASEEVNSTCVWLDHVCSILKNYPRYDRLENCAKSVISNHHISSWWEKSNVQTTKTSPWCPKRASNRTPDRNSGRQEEDTNCGRPCVKNGNTCTGMASTIHGRIDKRIFKCDGHFSIWSGNTSASTFSFRASSSTSPSNEALKNNLLTHIPKDPNCAKYADARNLWGQHVEKSRRSGGLTTSLPIDLEIRTQRTKMFKMNSKNLNCITNKAMVVQDLVTQWILNKPRKTLSA